MRNGPLVITFLVATALVAMFFIPHHKVQEAQSTLLNWANVVYAFALILGSVSLWTAHQRKVTTRAPGWIYSLVTLTALAFVTIWAWLRGSRRGRP